MTKSIFKKTIVGTIIILIVFTFFSFKSTKYFEISKNLEIFNSLYKELQIYYVDDIEPGDLIKKGIDKMLASLDPYTNYIPEADMEDYTIVSKREYGGIGSVIQKMGDYAVISFTYKDFPAAKSGLQVGDTIISIDGKNVTKKPLSDIRELLLGTPDTKVELKLKRYKVEEPLLKVINREHIKIKNVNYYGVLRNTKTGYIKLSGFTEGAGAEVAAALDSLKKEGITALILDLKDNGGGLLNEAVNIVNIFVDKGSLIVSTKGKVEKWSHEYYATNKPVDTKIPLIVCVNGSSASASEIVSGTLQDLDRAVIVGRNSFGKGLVQQVRPIRYNSKLKVTVAKYYTPSGRCIQKIDYSKKEKIKKDSTIRKDFKTIRSKRIVYDNNGITPDVKVDEEYLSDIIVALIKNNHFFHFTTQYLYNMKKVSSIEDFHFSEKDYTLFLNYLKGKDYKYETNSEKQLEKLKKDSKKEKIFDEIKTEFKQLKKKVASLKEKELILFKDEIRKQLESQIIGRLFFQEGQINYSINNYDKDISKALEIINQNSIASILKLPE